VIKLRYATQKELDSEGRGLAAQAVVNTISGTKEIVLFQKPTGVTLSHEISHFRLGHMDNVPKEYSENVRDYISEEIEAWVDTYKKLGRPRHLTNRLKGLISFAVRSGGFNSRQAFYLVQKELQQEGVPRAWREDLKKIGSEFGLHR